MVTAAAATKTAATTTFTEWPKKLASFLYALTLPNVNRLSQLFHSQYQEKICNNIITKDPTTLQVCRYTLPCEVSSV